jgi:glutaredoxin 3
MDNNNKNSEIIDNISPFEEPSETVYTVYTKSGCPYCTKVKDLLLEKKLAFDLIDCDEYLVNKKAEFLQFIQEKAGKEHRTFPMVFRPGLFIGGFTETKKLLDFEDAFAF